MMRWFPIVLLGFSALFSFQCAVDAVVATGAVSEQKKKEAEETKAQEEELKKQIEDVQKQLEDQKKAMEEDEEN